MIRMITILSFLISINIFAQKNLEFIGEKIDFALDIDRFYVNGIYYFSNNSEHNIEQTILFPFSKNADSIKVLRVYNLTYSDNLSFQKLNNAIVFKIFILPKDTIMINISYSQKTLKENVYVLESTNLWGQALKYVDFSFTVDESVNVDSLSIRPDSVKNNIYFWKKKNFSSNKNFVVWIR